MSEVEAPKATKTAPEMFANAKVPEEPAPGMEKEATSTSTEGGKPKVRSNGVPATRLAGWALPLVLIVAGVALWSANHRLALILFFLVAVVLLVSFVMHRMARRKANRQRVASAGELADPLTRGRQRGFTRGSFRGGRGGFARRRSTGRTGGMRGGVSGREVTGANPSGRGSTATSTRSSRSVRRSAAAPAGKRSLRDRITGRGRKGATGTGGAGRSKATERGERATGNTSTNRRSRTRSSGSTTGGGDGSAKKQSWWSRRRSRSTAPDAGTSSTAAPNTRRSRSGKGRGGAGDATGGGATSRGGSKRSPWWNRRKRVDPGDASKPTTEPKDTKPRPGKREPAGGSGRDASAGAKPESKRRLWRRRKDRGGADTPAPPESPKPASEKPKPEGDRRLQGRKERERNRKFLVDDGGFPSPIVPKPPKEKRERESVAKTKPAKEFPYDDGGFPVTTKPKPSPSRPLIATDDGGFPSSPHPASRATSSTTSHERSTAVSDDVVAAYLSTVDQSTAASRAQTYAEASAAAKRDAANFEAKGRAFRVNANVLQNKEGHVQAHVDHFLRQASACDKTAQDRLGISVALAACADRETTAAEKAQRSA